MSSPRVWVYLAYKKTGRISEEKLIEKSANEHLTQTIVNYYLHVLATYNIIMIAVRRLSRTLILQQKGLVKT